MFSTIIRYLWPWTRSHLATVQYLMYFRLCGWRHVFAQRSKYRHIAAGELFTVTRQVEPWAKSAVVDCLAKSLEICHLKCKLKRIHVCVCAGTAIGQMTTTSGLSSIASLSLGLSLSMSVSGSAAKDRLMDNALQSSMSSSSPMSSSGQARSRRSSSLVSQTPAPAGGQVPGRSAPTGSGGGGGGVRPGLRRQSAVSETSADATSMAALSPVVEQTNAAIIE